MTHHFKIALNKKNVNTTVKRNVHYTFVENWTRVNIMAVTATRQHFYMVYQKSFIIYKVQFQLPCSQAVAQSSAFFVSSSTFLRISGNLAYHWRITFCEWRKMTQNETRYIYIQLYCVCFIVKISCNWTRYSVSLFVLLLTCRIYLARRVFPV